MAGIESQDVPKNIQDQVNASNARIKSGVQFATHDLKPGPYTVEDDSLRALLIAAKFRRAESANLVVTDSKRNKK